MDPWNISCDKTSDCLFFEMQNEYTFFHFIFSFLHAMIWNFIELKRNTFYDLMFFN